MSWTITGWIGGALVALAAFLAFGQHAWLQKAETSEGVVTELIKSRGTKARNNYKPRIRFTANDGSSHELISNLASNPPAYSVGERVWIAYDQRTYQARILSFGERYGFTAVLASVGMALIFMSAAFIIGRQYVPAIYLRTAILEDARKL